MPGKAQEHALSVRRRNHQALVAVADHGHVIARQQRLRGGQRIDP